MKGGSGSDAKTYYQLQIEQMELDREALQRKPGADVSPTLPTGTVPRQPGGGIWGNVDRGPPPPVDQDES